MRSPHQTAAPPRRHEKCDLKRVNTKFSLDREIHPTLHRRRRAPRSVDIATLKILESATLAVDDTRNGSEARGQLPPLAYSCNPCRTNNKNQRKRKRERRFLMTPTMLEGDCHEIRRLFHPSNLCKITGLGDQQQRKKNISTTTTTTSEDLSKQHVSSDCLNECLQLVKDLNLLAASEARTEPSSSPSKL